MMAIPTEASFLPQELVELQLAQLELLMAMYPDENSVELSESTQDFLEPLKDFVQSGAKVTPTTFPSSISLTLCIPIEHIGVTENIQIEVLFPLQYHGSAVPNEPPMAKVKLQQPTWMSKAEITAVMATIVQEDDLTSTIDNITNAALAHLSQSREVSRVEPAYAIDAPVRVWFYFPSISTRSKRNDIVQHAPSYGLTGFLLAGKPGVLCLEGGSRAIDEYMKFIKTESWGDIPAHHKKVSERYRESAIERAFNDVQEITDEVGERRGERANRQDMKALEAWLNERNLGDAFRKVLI